jgi:curved DNA-binding protein CbpA
MAKTFNLYDILGVEQEASEADIRTAFRKLSFEHHPDRFSGPQRLRAEERFQGITEAFNVLSRPESRAKYDQDLAQGHGESAAMDPSEIARKLAAKGAQTFREGRITDAIAELKSALDHDDKCSRAHYFMGMALGRIKGREKEGMRHLERAAALEPNNGSILAEAASLAVRVGMRAKAKRLAEQALIYDPTSQKAAKALRDSAEEGPPSGGEGGLFGRLRRKG